MLLLRVLVNRTALTGTTGVHNQRALFRTRLPAISLFSSSSSGFKNSAAAADAGVATATSSDDIASSSNNDGEQSSATRSTTRSRTPGGQFSTSTKFRKGNYKRYDNYAPLLFEWTHKLVSGELTLETLMASEKYGEVSKAICDTTRHSDKNILNLLKSLVIMNLDPDTRLVQFLENELLLKLPQLDLRLLMAAYQIYSPPHVAMSSLLRGQIVDSINHNINDRLDVVEASLPDLIGLIRNSRHFTPEILLKIEDQTTRFLDKNENINLDQLCYLLVLLSRYSRRNKPLIRAVVGKLLRYRAEDVYSMPPHLIHMISSLGRLNFPEVNLLEKCSDILINLNFLEATTEEAPRRDFLVAISQFNFSYPKLIDYYLSKLQEKPEIFKRQDLITLTITLARLNYRSEDFNELLTNTIIPACSTSDPEQFVSLHQYFNFVYSLALLGRAPVTELRRVCSKGFLAQLEAEGVEAYLIKAKERTARQMAAQGLLPPVEVDQQNVVEEESSNQGSSVQQLDPADLYQVMSLRRKFLTLSGLLLAEDRQKGEKDEKLFESEEKRSAFETFIGSLDFEPMKRNKDLVVFRENVFKLLENFAPNGKYLLVDQKLPYGFTIDAQMLVDDEGQPQPLDSTQPNLKRIALMCIGFNDTLLDASHQLIGPKEAEVRILRSLGFIVVPVHQNVIPSGTTSLSRVKFLQNLIASHLKEAAAADH